MLESCHSRQGSNVDDNHFCALTVVRSEMTEFIEALAGQDGLPPHVVVDTFRSARFFTSGETTPSPAEVLNFWSLGYELSDKDNQPRVDELVEVWRKLLIRYAVVAELVTSVIDDQRLLEDVLWANRLSAAVAREIGAAAGIWPAADVDD